MSESGKGSARRPAQVSDEQYAERWDQIFHRKIDRVNAVRDLAEVTDAAEIRRIFEEDEQL